MISQDFHLATYFSYYLRENVEHIEPNMIHVCYLNYKHRQVAGNYDLRVNSQVCEGSQIYVKGETKISLAGLFLFTNGREHDRCWAL